MVSWIRDTGGISQTKRHKSLVVGVSTRLAIVMPSLATRSTSTMSRRMVGNSSVCFVPDAVLSDAEFLPILQETTTSRRCTTRAQITGVVTPMSSVLKARAQQTLLHPSSLHPHIISDVFPDTVSVRFPVRSNVRIWTFPLMCWARRLSLPDVIRLFPRRPFNICSSYLALNQQLNDNHMRWRQQSR